MTSDHLRTDALEQFGRQARADWTRVQRTHRPSIILIAAVFCIALLRGVQQIWVVRRLARLLSVDGDWLACAASAMRAPDMQSSFSGLEMVLRDEIYKAMLAFLLVSFLGACLWASRLFFLQRRKLWAYLDSLEERVRAAGAGEVVGDISANVTPGDGGNA
ncbi:MAG: hypothetical protein QM784_09825 [Polyangiaceae bacterium]